MDGSVDASCTDDGGVCTCIANVSDDKCDVCTTGWYGFPTCQGEICYWMFFDNFIIYKIPLECLCDVDGSVDASCTDDGGVCTCIANVSDDKCDVCTTGWYGFPTCQGEIYY